MFERFFRLWFGSFGLYFFVMLFWFCLDILGRRFLVEELLNSSSYKYA